MPSNATIGLEFGDEFVITFDNGNQVVYTFLAEHQLLDRLFVFAQRPEDENIVEVLEVVIEGDDQTFIEPDDIDDIREELGEWLRANVTHDDHLIVLTGSGVPQATKNSGVYIFNRPTGADLLLTVVLKPFEYEMQDYAVFEYHLPDGDSDLTTFYIFEYWRDDEGEHFELVDDTEVLSQVGLAAYDAMQEEADRAAN